MNKRLLVVVMVVVSIVVSPLAAYGATWSFARWGWSEPLGPKIDFRWGAELERTRLNDRWSVEDCEGDAWLICFHSKGGGEGLAEFSWHALRDIPKLQRDIEELGRAKALRRHAFRYYRFFREDRAGCPDGYTFHPFRPKPARVAGRDGLRYGFIMKTGSGKPAERSTSFTALTKSKLLIVHATGLKPRGCISGEGPGFRPRQLRRVEPYLARLAARGRLPE